MLRVPLGLRTGLLPRSGSARLGWEGSAQAPGAGAGPGVLLSVTPSSTHVGCSSGQEQQGMVDHRAWAPLGVI